MRNQASLTECNRLYRRFDRLRGPEKADHQKAAGKNRDNRPKGTLKLGDVAPEVKRHLHDKKKSQRPRGKL